MIADSAARDRCECRAIFSDRVGLTDELASLHLFLHHVSLREMIADAIRLAGARRARSVSDGLGKLVGEFFQQHSNDCGADPVRELKNIAALLEKNQK